MAGETQRRHPTWLPDQSKFFDELITQERESYNIRGWPATRRREVRSVLRFCAPTTVLNVGCGIGGHDVELANQPGVTHVHGIDVSARSVETAQRDFPHEKVHRTYADVFSMEGSYDLVISFQVIEHLANPEEFLQACARLSTRWVAVLTPNRERMVNRLRRLVHKPYALEDPQHFAEYTPEELDVMAAGVGLRSVGTFTYGMTIYLPVLGQVVPPPVGRLLARLLPRRGDRFGTVFELEPRARG
jgi:SAM-dependent methyltransferase